MNFVKLTLRSNGDPAWVNLERVDCIHTASPTGSIIVFSGNDDTLDVREAPDTILALGGEVAE